MLSIKRFSGVMNKDDIESDVLQGQHTGAKNVRFFGGANGLTAENVKGTVLVSNSNFPSGNNECNGAFFDSVRQRVLWFNWNEYGNHGIYSYDIDTATISQVFRCGVHSATDILGLSKNYPVHSCAIVYGNSGDGDLLYWTNGYGRPMYLNLDTVSALAPFTSDMIHAAKNAPLAPPMCIYRDDTSVKVNNLRKSLFRFSYRWVYKNGEKSTFSPISKLPLPINSYNPNISNDGRYNNNIGVTVYGGGSDYKAIEIVAQKNINNAWSGFFLIDTIDRTEYSVSPGAQFTYYFYNDGAYPYIPEEEAILYYSHLPDKANTLELLNGNVIIYGGITDGYDKIERSDVDVTINAGLSTPNSPTIAFSYAGTNVFTLIIGSTTVNGVQYNVRFNYVSTLPGDVSPKVFAYTTGVGEDQAAVAAGIASGLATNNISVSNLGSGVLRVSTAGMLGGSSITNVEVSTSASGIESATPCWKWGCPGRLGLIYFDDRGKTNGVVSFVGDSADTTDFAFTTPEFSELNFIPQIPVVNATINHTPPSWATSYQWVRADMKPDSFIYWVTNDYKVENGYLYFCIQNLIYQKEKISGFVPSYEFVPGDRIKVIAAYTAGNFIPYSIQLDMEIEGIVDDMNMANPIQPGLFLKVKQPSTLPSSPYQAAMLVELYRPKQKFNNKMELFYEWGEKFDIYTSGNNRYHRGGDTDQTVSQPATFSWYDGDVYYKNRRFYPVVDGLNTSEEFFMDANYSDLYESAVNSNGRGWVIDGDAAEKYNQVLVRWGGDYQAGTNINRLNIFRPSDFGEADRAKGDIRRFKVRDRILRVFQDRGVGQYGIYTRFIQNNSGETELVTTNEIITSNNIRYYQGNFGLCGYPTNLCSSTVADYFTDVVSGRGVRLSYDGMTDIGRLYKGNLYFPPLVTPFNKTLTRTDGSTAKVMAFFDGFDGDFHTILEAYSGGAAQHWSFSEPRNGYVCEYDYHPEWALCANDTIFSWYGGHLYRHTNTTRYCYFYGVQYHAEVALSVNDNLPQKKTFQSVAEVADGTWTCPEIYTNVMSYGNVRQESNIGVAEFRVLESMPTAAIKRDVNSVGGKLNGGFMKGNWLHIKFRKENASNLITLSEVLVRFTDSPLNKI